MRSPSDLEQLTGLARVCATATDVESLHTTALPLLVELAGARSALLLRREPDGVVRVAAAGASLGHASHDGAVVSGAGPALGAVPVPAEWEAAGVVRAAACSLPGGDVLLLTWVDGDPRAVAGAAVDVLASAEGRLHAVAELHDLTSRVDAAQQLAGMGDYDWHIGTDTNRWSDQLYRIYGHEPQSFNASYERFLALIHPDDRQRITAIHQEAYATGEPYQMIERIVRPDGQTRYLSSNGQVIMDAEGRPSRMRGTCIDITDRVLAEQQRERSAARLRSLVESSPDAILLHDGGRILQANGRAEELFGGDPLGRTIDEILPAGTGSVGRGVESQGLDGRRRLLDFTTAALGRDEEGLVALFVHDAAPRLAREELAATLREAEVRRRQALEINDNVVQGLTSALLALEGGDDAAPYLRLTLDSARRMMNDWLDPLHGGALEAGDLLRSEGAALGGPGTVAAVAQGDGPDTGGSGEPRVLVVDDCDDLRALLRLRMTTTGGYDVVGEASDGRQAVDLARRLQPDVVLLDLAMPVMDGLEALPLLKTAVPGVKVVVLSGFDQAVAAQKAIAAGADRYLEKGKMVSEIVAVVADVLSAPAAAG